MSCGRWDNHDPDVAPRWRTSHRSAGAGSHNTSATPWRPILSCSQLRNFWYLCFCAFDSRSTLLVHLCFVTLSIILRSRVILRFPPLHFGPKVFQSRVISVPTIWCHAMRDVTVFTARCTLVQSAVLRLHVVCLSVCPSVRLSVCNVGELWSHRLEFFENNFTIS